MGIHVNDLKSSTYIQAVLMLLIAFGYANAQSPSIAESIPRWPYSSQYENYNGTVIRLHIKDSNGNDHIRVKPDSDDTRIYFSFEPENGTNDVWINIRTKRDLDRETLGSTIRINLIITDDQHNQIKYEHLVYILDVNDNSPVFQNLPYTFDIDELPCNKTIVYSNIMASDRDNGQNGTVTFSMKPKTQTAEYNNTFSIDSTTAAVSLVKCLSLERNTYYHFVITAKDGGPNGGLTATTDLIIRVKDVQDKPPIFTGTYRKSINGSIARGTGVIQVNAVDGDLGISNEIFYSVLDSSCGDGLFAVDNHTGIIYASTDIEINQNGTIGQQLGNCVLTMEAREILKPNQKQYGNTTAVTKVTLEFMDFRTNLPQNAPYIASTSCGSFSTLSENDNGTVCRIYIKDSDSGDNINVVPNNDGTNIYFNIVQNNYTNDILIDITIKKLLDREVLGNNVTMMLLITDNQHHVLQYEHLVYIDDVNDNRPEFQNLPYLLEIDELPCHRNVVYTKIAAVDKDINNNGMVTYKMKPRSQTAEEDYRYNNTFSINPLTGAIMLDACLDYETNSYYHFVIIAQDGGPNGGLNSTTDMIIHVNDVQDEPPFFTATYRKTINGSITNGTSILRVNAVDGDHAVPNEISYAIKYSSCGDLFAIDSHTGVIYAATDVDINTGKVSQQLGHCVLTIEASEIEMPYQKQYGNTTTPTNVTLILWDVTNNTLPSGVGPACNHTRAQYTTTNTSPPTKMPLSCKEDWDFDNACNKSNVLKGVTKFPHPDSLYKFLICDVSGKTFLAQCPKNEVFHADCSSCALPNQNFSKSCTISNEMFRNPCSKENIIAGNLTFPHPDSTNKYIRCDSQGNSWEEECFSGSFWDQTQMICVLPEAFNPCHRRGSIVQTLYPHYCNPRLYVQCDNNGHPLVHMCQKDYVFLHYDLTCSPPAFPGTEYLRYTCN